MTTEHPITPPPELRWEWREKAPRARDCGIAREDWFMDRATQWGADQELEACVEWVANTFSIPESEELRAARRPKPPSLKEQALTQITQLVVELDRAGMRHQASKLEGLIRRALEALPND